MQIRSPIGVLVTLLLLWSVPQAQARDEVTLQAPVEITNIRYLRNAYMRCILSDQTKDAPSYSNQHAIANGVTLWFLPPDDPECRSLGRSNNAALRCTTSGEHGLSWSGDMEVTVRDFDDGLIKVRDAQHYRCTLEVRYDVDPLEAGFQGVQDNNCAGFGSPHNHGREIYQTLTDGDIEGAILCRISALTPGPNTVGVPSFHVRGTALGSQSTQDTQGTEGTQGQTSFNPRLLEDATRSNALPPPKGPQLRPIGCAEAVQGRIAWNRQGDTRWTQANIDRLCAGAAESIEPARCFQKAMYRASKVDTQWTWQHAVALCQGTRNATKTVSCLEEKMRDGKSREEAIEGCGAKAVVKTKQ